MPIGWGNPPVCHRCAIQGTGGGRNQQAVGQGVGKYLPSLFSTFFMNSLGLVLPKLAGEDEEVGGGGELIILSVLCPSTLIPLYVAQTEGCHLEADDG